LFSVTLLILITVVLLQGIHRQAISTFLLAYFKTSNIDTKNASAIFAMRCLPEALMLFLTPYFENFFGIYWMLFIGVFFGISRPLLYSVIELNKFDESSIKIFAYILEFLKGIFSGLFGYAGSKLLKKLSTKNTRTLAQGLFNGCYNGLAPFISGLIGYLYFDKEENEANINKDLRGFFLFTGFLGAIGLCMIFILIYREITASIRKKGESIEKAEVIKSVTYEIN